MVMEFILAIMIIILYTDQFKFKESSLREISSSHKQSTVFNGGINIPILIYTPPPDAYASTLVDKIARLIRSSELRRQFTFHYVSFASESCSHMGASAAFSRPQHGGHGEGNCQSMKINYL